VIKPCSVIYFPGSGGNFIKLCLALSKETVPNYYKPLDTYSDSEIYKIRSMSAQQRQVAIEFASLDGFKDLHATVNRKDNVGEVDFYYKNPLINDYFEWAILTNHLDNYHNRLVWLKKIIYLELDFEKHGHWIKNAGTYFKQFGLDTGFTVNNTGTYLPTQDQHNQVAELKNQAITTTISMSEILCGTDGFVQQYHVACTALNITPELDTAIGYYQKWRQFRVDPFI
jgi:hypothetical protein